MTNNPVFLGGIDEAGRGPLAGPVTAAAVVLPAGYKNQAVGDSKKLTAETRDALYEEIRTVALAYSIVDFCPRQIETLNIYQATRAAMAQAAEEVSAELRLRFGTSSKFYYLVDGNARLETILSHEPIIKGDDLVCCISAASILAKVWRDRLMQELDQEYPQYGFAVHKGYPTPYHKEQLRTFGPCTAHRRTFAGVREVLEQTVATETQLALIS